MQIYLWGQQDLQKQGQNLSLLKGLFHAGPTGERASKPGKRKAWSFKVLLSHETMAWFKTGKGVHQGCILSSCLFNLYVEYIR